MKNNVPPMKGRVVGYKFISGDSSGLFNTNFYYAMPRKNSPGIWMRMDGDTPSLCNRGFHMAWPQIQREIGEWGWCKTGFKTLVRVEMGGKHDADNLKCVYEYCRILKIAGEINKALLYQSEFINLTRKFIREDKKSIKDGAGPG